MDKLDCIQSFVKVVEHQSLSRAADDLGIGVSAVSKKLVKLEQSIGASLVVRSTRGMHVTQIGATYYDQCKDILLSIEEASRLVSDYVTGREGGVNISVSNVAGELIGEVLGDLVVQNPALRLSMRRLQCHSFFDIKSDFTVFISPNGIFDNSRIIVRPIISYSLAIYCVKGGEQVGLVINPLMKKLGLTEAFFSERFPGVCFNKFHDCASLSMAKSLVGKGGGLSVFPTSFVERSGMNNLKIIESIEKTCDLYISYYERNYRTVFCKNFLDFFCA